MERIGSNGRSFIAYLVTYGRVTGKEHKVPLRLVYYNGRLYASRRNKDSDWIKNVMHNSIVKVEIPTAYSDEFLVIHGKARVIDDDPVLSNIISTLKYDDERSKEPRVIVEIEEIREKN